VGKTLFFLIYNSGYELWKSDGTAAGTVQIKPISPSPYFGELTNVLGSLFFSANASGSGYELWRSDGTAAGTTMVQDLWPGAQSSFPSEFTLVRDKMFFTADGYLVGRELWAAPLSALEIELYRGNLPSSCGSRRFLP
jgi:ELWxxDGT repeat protein